MKFDRENFKIASNMTKHKYESLNEYSDNMSKGNKYRYGVVYDLSYLFNIFCRLSKIDPEDLNDKNISKKDKIFIANNIVNNISHYRHYCFSRLKIVDNILILYSSRNIYYKQLSGIFYIIKKCLEIPPRWVCLV